jgi:hypothetical protein
MTTIPGNLLSSDCHLFTAPQRNLGDHKLKDDLEVKKVVTR